MQQEGHAGFMWVAGCVLYNVQTRRSLAAALEHAHAGAKVSACTPACARAPWHQGSCQGCT